MDDFLKNVLYVSSRIITAGLKNESDTDEEDDFFLDINESDEFDSLLVVTFMTKRKTRCPGCLDGYFGLAVPTNFLEGRKRRKPFVAAFALASMAIIDELQSMSTGTEGTSASVKIIVKLILVLGLGCQFFPLFACIYMGTFPACVFGLIYHLLLVVLIIITEIPAPDLTSKALMKELLLNSIVLTIAGIFLAYWFIKRIIRFLKKESFQQDVIPRNQAKYVKSLFYSKERYLLLQEIGSLNENIGNKFFQFSLFSDNFSQLYDWISYNHSLVSLIVKRFTHGSSEGNETVTDASDISLYDFIYVQSMIILVVSIVAGTTAYILSILSICRLLTSYRKNVLGLSKQKQNQLILKVSDDASNISLVNSAIQYGGYQVAYLVAGFSIQLFSLNFILLLLGEIIILPIQFAFWSFLLKVFEIIGPILLALILIKLTQYLLIRFCFLEDKGKTMALHNRRGFFIMSYFVFFYNIFTGVFSCAKRIFKGALIGTFLVPRLDTSVFPRIFENHDSGFKAYSCLLHLEALQSNPVVLTFITFLMRALCELQKGSSNFEGENGVLLEPKKTCCEEQMVCGLHVNTKSKHYLFSRSSKYFIPNRFKMNGSQEKKIPFNPVVKSRHIYQMGNIVKQMLHAGAVGDLEEQIEKAGEQGNDTILMNEELARLTNFTVDDESEEYKKLYEDWEALYFFNGILIVTFMTKRKNKCPSCLCGYFALAVPVNFFELKSRRKPFLAAFALVTMTLVDGVISGTSFLPEEIKIPVYFKVIVKMLIASKALVKELLLRGIVFFIAGTYIFYWYIKQIFRFCSGRKKKIDNDSGKHEIKYVKHLLMREERDLTKVMVLTESRTNKCLEWFQKNISIVTFYVVAWAVQKFTSGGPTKAAETETKTLITFLVKSAIQYGGYQVAYLIAGFTIQLFVLNVTLILLDQGKTLALDNRYHNNKNN
uniref:Uncharacterized protein n=1 Tax=Strigamia maritima TaxID=126957 RepID=T1II79_STRMM